MNVPPYATLVCRNRISAVMTETDNWLNRADLDVESLSEWLRETYFDDVKPPFFSQADLDRISELLLRLLRFRPSERPSAGGILSHSVFGESAFRIDNTTQVKPKTTAFPSVKTTTPSSNR
jgi:serine/threonine protein kinase